MLSVLALTAPAALLSARAPQRLRSHPPLRIPCQSLARLSLSPIPTTAVQQFLHAGRSWNLQSFGGEFFCLALPTLRRDHDRGSESYGCGIIYMHLLRFVVERASLLLLRCAPAHRRIRVPTPRRHAAVPPSAHTSAGIRDALSHHHATAPVHQCSPGARFCDRLPSNPIAHRVRRKRQRLPPSLLIENASDRDPPPQKVCPEAFSDQG
jgi:hypothetical protein